MASWVEHSHDEAPASQLMACDFISGANCERAVFAQSVRVACNLSTEIVATSHVSPRPAVLANTRPTFAKKICSRKSCKNYN